MNIANIRKAVSMDFDNGKIRIVEGKTSKKDILTNKYCTIEIPEDIYKDGIIYDKEQLALLLKDGLEENNISKGDVHVIINSTIIILREVVFPKVDKEDIDNLINYQLGDFVPIHPEDYVIQYINLGNILEDGIEKLNILIIGVPKSMAKEHFELIREVGMKPTVLDFKGNAMTKLVNYTKNINDNSIEAKTIAMVDLSLLNTSITIVKDQLMSLSRLVDGGLNPLLSDMGKKYHMSEGEVGRYIFEVLDLESLQIENSNEEDIIYDIRVYIQNVIERLEMVLRYYTSRNEASNIDMIILHGSMSSIKGIDKFVSRFFDTPCIVLDRIEGVKFEGDLSKYANALGGLIRISGV